MHKQINGGRITMTKLFERTSINGMSLSNRFVRSATWEGLADKDGSVTPRLIEMMMELVKGEVGLIISSYAFVIPAGKSGPGQLAVYDDRFLPGLREMVQAVHSTGGKIALQIVHGGIFANFQLTGVEPIGPSAGEKDSQPTCRPMSTENIAEIISAFTRAAVRAKQAGFDAIQIHAAHGFLLSEFLSPAFNRRTDEFGGTLENRARLLLEVVRSIRKAIGTDYPILVKLNAEDFLENGMTREEAVQVSQMLEEASVDAIEFSGGTVASPKTLMPPRPGMLKVPENEVYYRETARLYKQKVNIPLMLVGGIRSYQVADALIESGTADYIALSRPLICEPGLVKRWRECDLRKAECVSDNECFGPASDGRGVYCVTMEKKRNKSVK
jgi:2,4-dienoyl-CoA reductase-like NADH-dependent reductase (Old Yellow Enzyme family)